MDTLRIKEFDFKTGHYNTRTIGVEISINDKIDISNIKTYKELNYRLDSYLLPSLFVTMLHDYKYKEGA